MRWFVAVPLVWLGTLDLGVILADDKPVIVATWEHQVVGRDTKPSTINLYSNGKINDPNGKETWVKQGNTLTLRWPNPKAPGGAWVDTCTVSSDGKTFKGRNQAGATLTGKLVGNKPAPKAPDNVASTGKPTDSTQNSKGPTPAVSAEDRRTGLELPPVAPNKAVASDTVMADYKTARAAYQDALKKARLTIRTQYMEIRKGLSVDAVKNAKVLQELNQQFADYVFGPGKSQDTGPLPTHPAMAEVVAAYWEAVDSAAKKFGEAATNGLAEYEKSGVTEEAKLNPLRSAQLTGENAEWIGVWSSGVNTGNDVWIVSVDEVTGGWRVEGEFNYRPGFTGNLAHGEKFKFAKGTLSFQAVPVRDRKAAGKGIPVSLTKLKSGKLQFSGMDPRGQMVKKTLTRNGDEHARSSIDYWGVPKAVATDGVAAAKPNPADANYVLRRLASLNSFPYLRDNKGPAWGEQFYLPWRSKHPTITPGPYGGLTDMLLGRAPGGGKNQQYMELIFKEFDELSATPFPYLKRANDEFHTLVRARFQLAEADELFGNTPNSSIREFQQKVMMPAAKYSFQRELDRNELQARLDRDFPGKYTVVDAPHSAESRAHLRDFIQGAKGISDDVQQRAVVSGLLAYADMAQVDQQAILWQTWLLPLAKRCGGPAATKPLINIEGNWKANAFSADRGKNVKLTDFLLKNVAGRDLTHVAVELVIENEWGDRAQQYYFFDRLEAAEVLRLTPHPRWEKRRVSFTNIVKAQWSVWADQGTEEGRTATLKNPTPIADAAATRMDYLKYDNQYQAEGVSLGEMVRNLPLLPVVSQRQQSRLLALATTGNTYLVQPAEKSKPLLVRFLSASVDKGTVELEATEVESGKAQGKGTIWKGIIQKDNTAGSVIRFENGWSLQLSPSDQLMASIPKSDNGPAKDAPLFLVKVHNK